MSEAISTTPSLGDKRLDAQAENSARGELKRPPGARWGRRCPHCKGPSLIRSSAHIMPNYVEMTRVCRNPMCGCIWVDCVYATRILSASMTPDLSIFVPMSLHVNPERVYAHMAGGGGSGNPKKKSFNSAQNQLPMPDPFDTLQKG